MKKVAVLAVAVVSAVATNSASAQMGLPSVSSVATPGVVAPYAGISSYNQAATVNESWARGTADVMRAAGDLNLSSSLAAKNWEAARKAAIDNWAYQIRSKNEIRDERMARDRAEHPPLSPTQQQYLTRIRDPKRLSSSQLTAAGVIRWPSALQTAEFDATRKQLDALFAGRAQGSTADADEITRNVDAAAIEMTKTLEQSGSAIPVMARVAAKNFVASLRYEAHLRPAAGEEQVASAAK